MDKKVRFEGGVAQGAPSSPLLYIFTTASAQAHSNSVVHGYLLPRLLPVDLGMPQLKKRSRTDLPQQIRCLLSIPHPCVAYVKGTGYADDTSNTVTTGGKAHTHEEARAIYLNLQNATEALTVGLTLVGVWLNLEKSFSTCSPVMRHLLGEELKLTVAAINSRGQLIRAAITTVQRGMPSLPHQRRGVQCATSDPVSAVGVALTKSQGRMLAIGVRTEAAASILSLVRDNFSAALVSYDAVSEATVTVLHQRLRTLLLLDTPTPESMMKMRGVVANSGMRALGLAPMNEELDNAVTVFLLVPHWLGGGGMGDPVIKCIQDSAITILAVLQHDSVAVMANYENLLAHARDRTRDIFFKCEVIQRQLAVYNSCDIMPNCNFTEGSNMCQRRDRPLSISQAKFSAAMISHLVVKTC